VQVQALSGVLMKDYSWIKVKQHKFDPEKSWEENYKSLESHHIKESEFLLAEIEVLLMEIDRLKNNIVSMENENGK
jgi:hypothetical protein